MRTRFATALVALGLLGGIALPVRAGLYDDEKKVTSGDLKDLDYWHMKFYHMELQAAMKAHEAEYKVGFLAEYIVERIGDLEKKYPNDTDFKEWDEECKKVVKAIDKNADRNADWTPQFAYWDNEAYRQAWVNMNLAKMYEDAKDWPNALMRYQWANENLGKIADHEDWSKNWPDDIKKWVKDTKEHADAKVDEMKKKQ